MRKIFTILLFACLGIFSGLRSYADGYWEPIHPALVKPLGIRHLFPAKHETLVLNTESFRQRLFALPTNPDLGEVIMLPLPDGSFRAFRVWKSSMMEPTLAERYPEIETFTAEAIDDRRVTAKLDFSPAGFHAMVYDGEKTYFIDPFSDEEDGFYLCYYKKEYGPGFQMSCAVEDEPAALTDGEQVNVQERTHGIQRRNYRLALACTNEYATAVGGATPTKSSVLAQMILVMNRVNGVYERELSTTMTLVANTDTLIYLAEPDPYSNGNGSTMLGQNVTNINNLIGLGNYDIGHVFSTGGGGVAGLSVLCSSTKARGVTGLSNPVGDPFAIDYVAHEMGHQFGSNHTFNSSTGSCSGNGVTNMAFEPGSGTTIMAYAGICGVNNIQANSDAYFHAASLRAITDHITNASTGGSCPVLTTSTNVPNTYPDFSQSYSIPVWTPFELTAPAVTDATSDTLHYCWEEWDLGGFGQSWNGTNTTTMPFFRSFTPASSPTRVFPAMNNILAGNYNIIGERLPELARSLKFILTTRDIYQGWGCFNASFDSDTVIVNAVATPDTFLVTSQATTTTWDAASTQTITWDVAGTTAAPVNAANVNIYLSVDSGRTFPYVLATGVPNSGSANIVVPALLSPTTKARVKVKGAGNVFFQINRSNIIITLTPLPLQLEDFTASIRNCDVELKWLVDLPATFATFEAEISSNGTDYRTIQSVAAANNTKSYSITYPYQEDGRFFFRLKMKGVDGKSEFSKIITAHLSCNKNNSTVAYPNPVKNKLIIEGKAGIIKINAIASNGKVTKMPFVLAAHHKAVLDMSNLPAGIYMIQTIIEDGSIQTFKTTKE